MIGGGEMNKEKDKTKLKDISISTSIDGVDELKQKLSRVQCLVSELQKELNSISEMEMKLNLKS